MLTEFEDRLSTVQRWAVIRTLRRQSVMEHSARVAMIAHRIATHYFQHDDNNLLYQVLLYSLYHDEAEAVTGDLPKTAKPYLNEGQAIIDNAGRLLLPEISQQARLIVKMADTVEALLFLENEIALGNASVYVHRGWLRDEFHRWLRNYNLEDFSKFMSEWMKTQWPHGFGVGHPYPAPEV